jgi:hypothetical protein
MIQSWQVLHKRQLILFRCTRRTLRRLHQRLHKVLADVCQGESLFSD